MILEIELCQFTHTRTQQYLCICMLRTKGSGNTVLLIVLRYGLFIIGKEYINNFFLTIACNCTIDF